LNAWQIAQLARHPQRPYTLDYIERSFTDFQELHGDRMFAEDASIVGGLARFDGRPCVVLGHQKGRDTKEKIARNFGMPKPEGYRKALRLMRLAEKFELPVFTFVDTPGAYPGIDAEERGQSEAIGRNLYAMAGLRTPILTTIIGEGGSGGALAIAVGDTVIILDRGVTPARPTIALSIALDGGAGTGSAIGVNGASTSVSLSLAGTPVKVDEWEIDAIYSASQKCLSCTPGLSPVSFSERVVEHVKKRKDKIHSWFMDMNLLFNYWDAGTRTYHHTAPTNSLFALHEALLLIREEGLENAWARATRHHLALKAGLEAMGLKFLVKEQYQLPQMNAVLCPEGVNEEEVRRRLLGEFGLEIGAGLGPLKGKIWRFGLMGYSCRADNVMLCLSALGSVLDDMGYPVHVGDAEAAAHAAYAAMHAKAAQAKAKRAKAAA